jgi:hypothetical protein
MRRLFEVSEEELGRIFIFYFLLLFFFFSLVKILGDHCGGFGGR